MRWITIAVMFSKNIYKYIDATIFQALKLTLYFEILIIFEYVVSIFIHPPSCKNFECISVASAIHYTFICFNKYLSACEFMYRNERMHWEQATLFFDYYNTCVYVWKYVSTLLVYLLYTNLPSGMFLNSSDCKLA